MKLQALIDSIKQSIATGISTPVKIVERSFLLDIVTERSKTKLHYLSLRDMKGLHLVKAILHNIRAFMIYIFHSPYLNFLILLSTFVSTILLLIAMISFFLSQVILPKSNQYVNDSGTLVFDQPLATEHYMFLLNSANLWADSGIEVIKGDNVLITVSGSFYSDIDELCDAAKDNIRLRYYNLPKNESVNKYILDKDKNFGDLLVRIQRPGDTSMQLKDISKVKENSDERRRTISFVAPESGILQFSVNDILLDPNKAALIATDPEQKHLRIDTTYFNRKYKISEERASRQWFDDNCGELLINVKISRNIAKRPDIPFYDKIFISSMRILF